MASELIANAFAVQLTSGCAPGDLTIQVTAAAPSALQGGQFRLVIDQEYMIVTAGQNTTTWTVTRAAEGSTAAAHQQGSWVTHLITAGSLAGGNLSNLVTSSLPPPSGGDDAAVHAALIAAAAAGTTFLGVRGATYVYNSTLTGQSNITLDFQGATVVNGPSRSGANLASDTLIDASSTTAFEIRNMILGAQQSSPTAQTRKILANQATRFKLSGCRAECSGSWFVDLQACIDPVVERNYINHGTINGWSNEHAVIDRNILENSPGFPINMTGYASTSAFDLTDRGLEIIGNVIRTPTAGSGFAIQCYANAAGGASFGATLRRNRLELTGSGLAGISCTGNAADISDNTILDPTSWGIESDSQGTRIHGNRIVWGAPQASAGGITINTTVATPTTTLAASVTLPISAGTIQLTSSTGFDPYGSVVMPNGTVVTYTGVSGNNLTGCNGGSGGAIATGTVTLARAGEAGSSCIGNQIHNAATAISSYTAAGLAACTIEGNLITEAAVIAIDVSTAGEGGTIAGNIIRCSTPPPFSTRFGIKTGNGYTLTANKLTWTASSAGAHVDVPMYFVGSNVAVIGNVIDHGGRSDGNMFNSQSVGNTGSGFKFVANILLGGAKIDCTSLTAPVAIGHAPGGVIGGGVPTITGSKAANAALVSLMPALVAIGAVIDSTT